MTTGNELGLLRRHEIEQGIGVPDWGVGAYEALKQDMLGEESPFPCIFGVEGFRADTLCYSFIGEPTEEQALFQLRDQLIRYTEGYRQLGRNTSLVAFFQPMQEIQTMDQYERIFWDVIHFLHKHDPQAWPRQIPHDTGSHLWEFCFNGEPIFVVCNTPAHEIRKSRKSKTFMITFQPLWVFDELTGERGLRAVQAVRQRLASYDKVGAHPALGLYGEEDKLEWKQYFLKDDNSSPTQCPFHALHKEKKAEGKGA
ncbi:YqcI/YcgG family protein [Brevibacillus dissolubilis]|uniref:YqcI/YcgG family protein n=1 Tax=Brevibacillus dissolubilis TaxID=1844116 RepID=UPI001115D027|nr:YqcI/YcgG family protein [Brevibacillus dissolubilis]